MQVHPTRPNLNTSVLKWKRVSGKSVGQPTADADFAIPATPEGAVASPAG
jgi:hypothetical protein